jgi:pseudouridine synthase
MLARAGIASRREAEELIRKGRVRVNGTVAVIGMSVDPNHDIVEVSGKRVRTVAPVWIALHKPVGYVVTKRDERRRPTVFELVPSIPGLTYVGRLDVNTSGLLLMTNDGAAINLLTHPRHQVERTYVARVQGLAAPIVRRALRSRIVVGGRPVGIVASRIREHRKSQSLDLQLTLVEGRNRIVRRTCEAIGLRVQSLTRLTHGPVDLGNLACGEWRYLTTEELEELKRGFSIQIDS